MVAGRPTASAHAGAHAAAELRERLLERRHVELYAARLPAGPLLTPRLPYACIRQCTVSERKFNSSLRRGPLPPERLLSERGRPRLQFQGSAVRAGLREIGAFLWGAVLTDWGWAPHRGPSGAHLHNLALLRQCVGSHVCALRGRPTTAPHGRHTRGAVPRDLLRDLARALRVRRRRYGGPYRAMSVPLRQMRDVAMPLANIASFVGLLTLFFVGGLFNLRFDQRNQLCPAR